MTRSSSSTATVFISNASGSNGLTSAIALGTTTITATLGSVSGSTTATLVTLGYAYVSNRDDNTISEYAFRANGANSTISEYAIGTGSVLSLIGTVSRNGGGPFTLAMDPTRDYLYAADVSANDEYRAHDKSPARHRPWSR